MVGKSKIVLPEAPPIMVRAKSFLNENKGESAANNQAEQPCSNIPPILSRWAPGANNQDDRPMTIEAIPMDKPESETGRSHSNNVVGPVTVIKTTPADHPSNSNKGIVLILACLIIFGCICFFTINQEPLNHANGPVVTSESPSGHGVGETQVGSLVAHPTEFAIPSTAPETRGDGTFSANRIVLVTPNSAAKEEPPKIVIPKTSHPKNEPKKPGFQEWLILAEQGDLQSQSQVAHMYATGEGTKKNYEEAFRWNLIAAKRGSIRAQSNLGVCYGMGNGVERDNIEACAWWHIAARSGSTPSRINLKKYEKFFTEKQMKQSLERANVLSRQIRD